MNTKQLIAAAALAVVGSAASAQTMDVYWQQFGTSQASAVSRQEVRAELVRARQAGDVKNVDEVLGSPAKIQASTVTREQVRAELAQARAEGLLDIGEYTMVADNVRASAGNRAAFAAKKAGVQAGH